MPLGKIRSLPNLVRNLGSQSIRLRQFACIKQWLISVTFMIIVNTSIQFFGNVYWYSITFGVY